MKITNIILIFVLAVTSAFAQSQQCGTDALMMGMPRQERMMPPPEVDLDTAEVMVIPVVFHVVHLGEPVGEGTNISDEQIQSAVVALNEDFRKIEGTNGDGLGVDTKIEFCLASRTPDNQPTTGIVRHDGSNLVYGGESYAEDGVSATSLESGVSNNWLKSTLGCWDKDEYLNIWVVSEIGGNNGGGGIQGFSYIGAVGGTSSQACYSGVVQLYNVTGTIGNIKTGNKNRVTTHEVGHYFDLYHTFENTSSCVGETNCETQGDRVCDTPVTTTNYFCSSPECPDAQVENYMDYTGQTCRNTFTQGQAERMRYEIYTGYEGLQNSIGCIPVIDVDGGITNAYVNTPTCITTNDVFVHVTNFGSGYLNNPTITIDNGLNIVSETFIEQLPSGVTNVYQMPFLNVQTSTIDIDVSFFQSESYLDNNSLSIEQEIFEGNVVSVEVKPDVWSNTIDWEITDESGSVILSGGDYPVFSQNEVFVEEGCVMEGCYTFTITDSQGDGIASYNDDSAYYQISINDEPIILYSFVDGTPDPVEDLWSERSEEFCSTTIGCEGDITGDNIVNVNDIMLMLTNMGCVAGDGSCIGDLDGDGATTNADLQIVINNYGIQCGGGGSINTPPTPFTKNLEAISSLENAQIGYYDISGRFVGNDKGILRTGIYIHISVGNDGQKIIRKIYLQ